MAGLCWPTTPLATAPGSTTTPTPGLPSPPQVGVRESCSPPTGTPTGLKGVANNAAVLLASRLAMAQLGDESSSCLPSCVQKNRVATLVVLRRVRGVGSSIQCQQICRCSPFLNSPGQGGGGCQFLVVEEEERHLLLPQNGHGQEAGLYRGKGGVLTRAV